MFHSMLFFENIENIDGHEHRCFCTSRVGPLNGHWAVDGHMDEHLLVVDELF